MLNQNHHLKSEEAQTNIFFQQNKTRCKISTLKQKFPCTRRYLKNKSITQIQKYRVDNATNTKSTVNRKSKPLVKSNSAKPSSRQIKKKIKHNHWNNLITQNM